MTPPDRLPAFDVTLPGDISTASLPIACVVASPLRRRLVIEDVGINETRTGFIRTLQAMGAGIEIEPTGMEGNEPVGRIVVESGHQLRGIELGGASLIQSMIDELPMLAALAARAEGRTVIRDAQELKDKDTDRIATTVAALRPFGVRIEGREDGFVIEPSELSSAKSLVLPPDHRVIFAAMTLGEFIWRNRRRCPAGRRSACRFRAAWSFSANSPPSRTSKRCEAGGERRWRRSRRSSSPGAAAISDEAVARWWAKPGTQLVLIDRDAERLTNPAPTSRRLVQVSR